MLNLKIYGRFSAEPEERRAYPETVFKAAGILRKCREKTGGFTGCLRII